MTCWPGPEMTNEATFGDFLDDARRQVAGTGRAPAGGEDLRDTSQSIRRVIVVLGPVRPRPRRRTRHRATSAARPRVTVAAGSHCRAPRAEPGSPLPHAAGLAEAEPGHPAVGRRGKADGRRGRHAAGGPRVAGHPRRLRAGRHPHPPHRWAPALTSPRSAGRCWPRSPTWPRGGRHQRPDRGRARLARRARAAPRPARSQSTPADPAEFVQAASQHEPVPAAQRELLRAVPPGSALPPRRLPGPSHDIAHLREGTIVTAQRMRRAAWRTATQTAPAITTNSLRHNADASTLASYHCELLLRAAADRAAAHFTAPDASQEITRAADAAGRARASWLAVGAHTPGASPSKLPATPLSRREKPATWPCGPVA